MATSKQTKAKKATELAEKQLFKKQILRVGEWLHKNAPNGKLTIDKTLMEQLVENFKRSPFAPITRGHRSEEELEQNPSLIVTKNISGLEMDEEGLYALMELDKDELDKYNDVSVSIDPEYTDHESGKSIGALLKHVALVVNPYIKGLNPFVALHDKEDSYIINLSEIKEVEQDEKKTPVEAPIETKSEVVESVVVETPVAEVKEEAPKEEVAPEVKAEVVLEPVAPEVKEEVKVEEPKPVEASEVTLKDRIAELEAKLVESTKKERSTEAKARYEVLLHEGKIVPAQKEAFINLCEGSDVTINLSDGGTKSVKELLEDFIAKSPVLVDFEEKGKDVEAQPKPVIPATLLDELRKKHIKLTDVEFEAWIAKNQATILENAK